MRVKMVDIQHTCNPNTHPNPRQCRIISVRFIDNITKLTLP